MGDLPDLHEVTTPALVVARKRLVGNISPKAARAASLGVAFTPASEGHHPEEGTVVDAWSVATREWREAETERRPAWSIR